MDARERIERALETAIAGRLERGCPPGLSAAVQYAVFPGGARVRPRLCLAVAAACGERGPGIADGAASAIELLHCASLRRGKPSVHCAYGERLAVLAGDALIVTAFEALGRASAAHPDRLVKLLATIAASVSMPTGIVAGQAWECETQVVLDDYQRAKTGSLFAAAAVAGAQAAGADSAPWRELGERLGEAYQVADDIQDVASAPEQIGKPVGRDRMLGRPNAVEQLGLMGAVYRVKQLVTAAVEAVPVCAGAGSLRMLIQAESQRILPKELARLAA